VAAMIWNALPDNVVSASSTGVYPGFYSGQEFSKTGPSQEVPQWGPGAKSRYTGSGGRSPMEA